MNSQDISNYDSDKNALIDALMENPSTNSYNSPTTFDYQVGVNIQTISKLMENGPNVDWLSCNKSRIETLLDSPELVLPDNVQAACDAHQEAKKNAHILKELMNGQIRTPQNRLVNLGALLDKLIDNNPELDCDEVVEPGYHAPFGVEEEVTNV